MATPSVEKTTTLGQDVRQDVAGEDRRPADAVGARGQDELALAQAHRLREHDPAQVGAEVEPDDQHDDLDVRRGDGEQRDRHEQHGQAQDDVDRPHQERLEETAAERGAASDDDPDQGGQHVRAESHRQRDARAEQEPAELVAPERVGAEQEAAARRQRRAVAGEPGRELPVGWVRGDDRREHGGGGQEHTQRQPRHGDAVGAQAPPRLAPVSAPGMIARRRPRRRTIARGVDLLGRGHRRSMPGCTVRSTSTGPRPRRATRGSRARGSR